MIMDGYAPSTPVAIEEGALMMALVTMEEAFPAQPRELGMLTLTAAHFCSCIVVAPDAVLASASSV